VAGDGPLRADLERRATRAGLRESIDFTGWVVPDRVMALINEHAVVIMPSRRDSMPLVALEAAAMARPVVATRVGGLPEIVAHEETGLLAGADDVPALADAASRLLANPDQAARMGQAARARAAERFSWDGHVASYDALYRALASRRARGLAAAASS
jgi:glycogen(starch) synthase